MDFRIPETPPAKQTELEGQSTVLKPVTPAGTVAFDHVDPPSSVTMIEAKCPDPSLPTATHRAEVGEELDAQDTALTFGRGL